MSLSSLELLLILSLAISLSALTGVCVIMKRLKDVGVFDSTPPAIQHENKRSIKKSPLRF